MAFLNGNIATERFVASVDILAILFKGIDSTLDGDVREGRAVYACFFDLHAGD
jgi:hypothetical protein